MPNTKFSDRLKGLMEQSGVNQSKLANDLGCNKSTISKWSRGIMTPDHRSLVDLCRYFGVTADFLTGIEDASNYLVGNESESDGIKWIFNSQQSDDYDYNNRVKIGHDLFKYIVEDKMSASDVIAANGPFPNKDWNDLNNDFKIAVRSGALRITGIEQDKDLEGEILDQFNHIKKIVVVKIPQNEQGYIDGT